MAITVYRWDDASAPVISGTTGGLITLLDAVLVNGYGAKASQGWTKPFGTSSNVTVYQQPTGTNQRLLRIDDGGYVYSGTYYYAKVNSYEAMTDMNTGSGKIPTTYQKSAGYSEWATRNTGTTISTWRWMVVADVSRFMLVLEHYSNNVNNTFLAYTTTHTGFNFYGDLYDASPSDAYATVLSNSQNGTNGLYNAVLVQSNDVNCMYIHRNASQTGNPVTAKLVCATGNISNPTLSVPYPNARGGILHAPILCFDGLDGGTGAVLSWNYRGSLFFVDYFYHTAVNLNSGAVYGGDTFSDGVRTYTYATTIYGSWNGVSLAIAIWTN